ncbi:MAG: ABC transporter permease, partial [Oscillospiraceae bacterium]|nr:ABC transporter permease [Oscillospiraceae bacterium]
ELELYKTAGGILTNLYDNRSSEQNYVKNIIPVPSNDGGFKSILIAITLVTAMFMGCTFNAMNIIGEKEDGVALINKIIPMTAQTYIAQKTILGFIGGFLSTVITALICIRIDIRQLIPLIFLIILSAYIAALIGLFIGYFSSGLMVGIVYIKIVMIMFLAPPIVFYLMIPAGSILHSLSYLIPSSAAFYGIMDLLSGQTNRLWLNIVVLLVHSVLLSCLYLFLHTRRLKQQ